MDKKSKSLHRINRTRKTPKQALEEGYDMRVNVLVEMQKGSRKRFKVSNEHYFFRNEIIKQYLLKELANMITDSIKMRLEMNEYRDWLKSQKNIDIGTKEVTYE